MRRILALCLAALAFMPAAAGAQKRRDELREKVRAFRVARLIEVLDLDEQTTTKLMVVLNKGYDQMADLARDSGAARRELRGLLVTDRPDDARVNGLVDRLLANKTKMEALRDGMLRDARKVLSPRQVGRLVLALPEIEQQINQKIRRAAEGPPGPEAEPPE
jgi:Spy/CpxP family protein refolding chaperone